MPRKEILVMGFRHAAIVKKCLSQRKAAEVLRKLHATATVPKAAASHASKGGQAAGQSGVGKTASRSADAGAGAPSFAASALARVARQAPATPIGFSLKAAATAVSRAAKSSPSFAALPFFGKKAAEAAVGAAKAAPAAAAAAAGPRRVPAGVRSDPLYRFAKLSEPARATSQGAAAEEAQPQRALLQYAKLGAGSATKKAASKLSNAAALLKYAKLK